MKTLWSEKIYGRNSFAEGVLWKTTVVYSHGGYNGRSWWTHEVVLMLRKVMP